MTADRIPKDPYLGYDAGHIFRLAQACLACPEPAPCTVHCAQGVDVQVVMRLAGKAAGEALPVSRWLMEREAVESARITDQICDAYN